MSKKSRRRNKKILAALALAGGAALMAKRGKGVGDVSTAGQAVGVDRITPPSKWITKKDVLPESKPIVPAGTDMKGFGHPIIQGNINRKKAFLAKANTPGYGTAVAPPGILNPYRRKVGGGHPLMQGRTTNYKKGGRVTGIAKRGFGRALMKGKK